MRAGTFSTPCSKRKSSGRSQPVSVTMAQRRFVCRDWRARIVWSFISSILCASTAPYASRTSKTSLGESVWTWTFAIEALPATTTESPSAASDDLIAPRSRDPPCRRASVQKRNDVASASSRSSKSTSEAAAIASGTVSRSLASSVVRFASCRSVRSVSLSEPD